MIKAKKTFVDVNVNFDKDGNIIPLKIVWKDGTEYIIDRITDVRRAASLKVGGIGLRYTCRINNISTFLFFDDKRWFVEEK